MSRMEKSQAESIESSYYLSVVALARDRSPAEIPVANRQRSVATMPAHVSVEESERGTLRHARDKGETPHEHGRSKNILSFPLSSFTFSFAWLIEGSLPALSGRRAGPRD